MEGASCAVVGGALGSEGVASRSIATASSVTTTGVRCVVAMVAAARSWGDQRRVVDRDHRDVDGLGKGRDPHGERRIERPMGARMFADQHEHRGVGSARVVDEGEAVRETRTQVDERRPEPAEPTVCIGRSHRDEFVGNENRARPTSLQGIDENQFARTGIGEDYPDAEIAQGQRGEFGSVHASRLVQGWRSRGQVAGASGCPHPVPGSVARRCVTWVGGRS